MLFKREMSLEEKAMKAMLKTYKGKLRKQRKQLSIVIDEMMKTSDMGVAVMLAKEIRPIAEDIVFYAGEIKGLKKELKSMQSTR